MARSYMVSATKQLAAGEDEIVLVPLPNYSGLVGLDCLMLTGEGTKGLLVDSIINENGESLIDHYATVTPVYDMPADVIFAPHMVGNTRYLYRHRIAVREVRILFNTAGADVGRVTATAVLTEILPLPAPATNGHTIKWSNVISITKGRKRNT